MCARIIETETAIEKQPNNCDNRDGHPHTIENKRARIDAAAAAPVQAGILYPEAGNVFVEKFDAWKRQTSLIEADLESNAHTSDGEGDEGFDDPLFYM